MTKQDAQAFVRVRTEAAGEIELAYYEADSRAEEKSERLPLVMLHGGGPGASSWSNFGPALPGFAEEFRTILVDQPGFGASDKPPVVGNYYRFASDAVVALLDELGIERVHLLGNSLGGGTAMRLALSHPDRVGRLIMMGPGGLSLNLFHADPTEGVQRLMDFGANPSRETLRAFISTMVVDQSLVTDELVEARHRHRAGRPGRHALDGDVLLESRDRRGRHAVARGAPAAQAHPAHLGPRGPGQPARRCDGRPQAHPEGPAPRLPELRPLGPALT